MPDGGTEGTPGRLLEGTRWRVTVAVGPDGSDVSIPTAVRATLRLEDGRLAGRGGCNRLAGGYQLAGTSLSFGPLASTMMACPEPAATVEAAIVAALGTVAAWRVDGDGLALLDADGRTVLALLAADVRAIVGPTWTVTGINNGRGGVVSLVAGTSIDAVFGDDGTVTGSAGCNRFRGAYRLDGGRIAVEPLATTRMACPGPVMEQEAVFLAAMGRATVARVDDDDALELRDDGALQVRFRAGT